MSEEPSHCIFEIGIPITYIRIPKILLCIPYLLRYADVEFGSHFNKCYVHLVEF